LLNIDVRKRKERLLMKREEIAKKMASSVIDLDKELIANTYYDIQIYLGKMRQEFNLKAKYENLSIIAAGGLAWLKFMGRSLEFTLNEKEIVVNLINEDEEREEFDVIRSVNEKLVCNDGEFELSELDGFIERAFGDLLS
jgi:hypothetical protein